MYDHKNDPNEFINQANNSNYKDEKDALKKYLPTRNATWDPFSSYTFQPYFVEQKARTIGSDGLPVDVIGPAH